MPPYPKRLNWDMTMSEYEKLVEELGSIQAAADSLGIPRTTLRDRIKRLAEEVATEEVVVLPDFPEPDIDINEVLEHLSDRFNKRVASYDAHTWYPVKITQNKPMGIVWFGDPHLGDSGCNLPELRRHTEICRTTPGMYGANIGDSSNNWAGNLVRLYAEQDTSKKTERRLVEWFMTDSGVNWLLWLVGNHDAWGDGAEIIARMVNKFGTQKILLHDWEARFSLKFPNGYEPRINAAHDFKGTSQFNRLQGPMKAGILGADADLYICGHRHEWAVASQENAERGHTQHFVRVRGYKFNDEYARRLGIIEQKTGCAILTIFDPIRRKITVFEDIEEGARFLTLLRRT